MSTEAPERICQLPAAKVATRRHRGVGSGQAECPVVERQRHRHRELRSGRSNLVDLADRAVSGGVVGSIVTVTLHESAPAGMATCSAPSDEATIPPVVPTTAEVISMFVRNADEPHPRAEHRQQPHRPDLNEPSSSSLLNKVSCHTVYELRSSTSPRLRGHPKTNWTDARSAQAPAAWRGQGRAPPGAVAQTCEATGLRADRPARDRHRTSWRPRRADLPRSTKAPSLHDHERALLEAQAALAVVLDDLAACPCRSPSGRASSSGPGGGTGTRAPRRRRGW